MEIRTHKYAGLAYPLVEKVKNSDVEAKYRTLALNFPTMIMQAGLAQAIGFLKAKGKDEHTLLLQHIETVLKINDLHVKTIKSNISEYQLLTRQAIEAASWLKRYTQALLDKNKAGA
ncbi:MAG: type III-B CRISPR module-associated protein Cmr5 [Moraxella sp.]|nr:type III-B CRISPR module-associated protein Cmr5 [Moraxella sp.]